MNSFQKQEEGIKMFKELSQSKGVKEDAANIKKILEFAEYVKFDVESVMHILAGEQSLSPEQIKKIRYLHAEEVGKVRVPAPRSILDLVIIPPEPLGIEGRKCSLMIHIDALEHNLIAYFAINYKDFLTEYVEYPSYDGAIEHPRNFMNEFFVNFTRVKDKSMGLVESELSLEVRYKEECPKKYRVFEMELIEIETETLRYGLKYANGRVLKSVGNLPVKEIVKILESVGVWQ